MQGTVDVAEQAWLKGLRQGDESALRQIFDRHYPLLLADLYRLIPDEDTGKDLAQEVFVELWRKRQDLDIHTSLRAYLRRAAQNRAINFIKTQRRILLDEPETWTDTADSSSQDIQQQNRQEGLEVALHEAIGRLPERCRIVFALSRFERLSHKEIAEKLDISVKTIENQITKAMKLLRDALTQYSDLSPVIILLLNWWWMG
ncbi:MAG: RNA polymerase sigma-70 factor [Saprospiraceae bacterium]|nr:RNA polymerase sigma-70 factor [Saprospiraceae bacterium]